MLSRLLKKRLVMYGAVVALAVLGAAAVGWTCDGYDCNPDVSQCVPLLEWTQDTCCQDPDANGTFHCMQCTRQWYECIDSSTRTGPAFDCHSPGAHCAP